ncbi:MAG TPA: S-methyl-5-thioribose-1-phosphate isomerase, partial [Clostridiales bacterium UBA9856]|nr:S-methyl-5-thioribose-1-phosphate isomerase [Clostridiales bacterium UBA9856]
MSFKVLEITPVKLDDDKSELILLDQTLLPGETKYLHLTTIESIWEAIYKLRVRGAPAIGITGAYGAYLAVKHSRADNFDDFYAKFKKAKEYLGSSRPTAVNLFWALDRMEDCLLANKDKSISDIKRALLDEANLIRQEDEDVCRSIGEHGLSKMVPGMGLSL